MYRKDQSLLLKYYSYDLFHLTYLKQLPDYIPKYKKNFNTGIIFALIYNKNPIINLTEEGFLLYNKGKLY